MSEPLYEVGQVVVVKSMKRQMPFKILARMQQDGVWYYAWNRRNYAAESMLRALTPDEMGTDHA